MNTKDVIEFKIPMEKLIPIFSHFDNKFNLFGRSVSDFNTGEAMAIKVANHEEVLLNVRDVIKSPIGIFDVSYNYMKKREFQKKINLWVRSTIVNTLNNLTEVEVEYTGRRSCGRRVGIRAPVEVSCIVDAGNVCVSVLNPQHLLNHWYSQGLILNDFYTDLSVPPGKFALILVQNLKKLIQYNEFYYSPDKFGDIVIDCRLLRELIDNDGEKKIAI